MSSPANLAITLGAMGGLSTESIIMANYGGNGAPNAPKYQTVSGEVEAEISELLSSIGPALLSLLSGLNPAVWTSSPTSADFKDPTKCADAVRTLVQRAGQTIAACEEHRRTEREAGVRAAVEDRLDMFRAIGKVQNQGKAAGRAAMLASAERMDPETRKVSGIDAMIASLADATTVDVELSALADCFPQGYMTGQRPGDAPPAMALLHRWNYRGLPGAGVRKVRVPLERPAETTDSK